MNDNNEIVLMKKISFLQKKKGKLLNDIHILNEWLSASKLELVKVTNDITNLESQLNPYDD